jgi:CRISPR-associated protein Csx16
MTRWFVSRHSGAVAWARRRGLHVDRFAAHLNARDVSPGDVVMGTLPVQLAAEVCERGAKFYALCLAVNEGQRGADLGADELEELGARLQRYHVRREEDDDAL